MKRIEVSDFTLKITAEDNALTFRAKTEIARCVNGIGVDAIELSEVKNEKEDAVINRTIASVVDCVVAIPVGMTEEGVNTAYESISSAKNKRLQVVLPSSTVGMEYLCHVKAPKMLEIAAALCSAAAKKCSDVEFIAADASRAEREFLVELCKTAAENGAEIITLSDDAGIMLPDEFAKMVKDVKSAVDKKIYCTVSNAISMATACAVAVLLAGADGVKTASVGNSTLSAGQFADFIRAKGNDLGLECGLNISGVHRDVDQLIKNVKTETDTNGVVLSSVKLTADSTLADVSRAVKNLGYELSDEDNGKVFEQFKRVSARKGVVGKKELDAMVATAAMQVPSTYHIESYVINSGNVITATASISLTKDGEKFSGISAGDGPINAAFLAIEQIVGHHYELDDFQIQSVTEGHEAVGSAVVKLRSDGVLYSGTGISTDIIGASIRAYINALNKIVYTEQ